MTKNQSPKKLKNLQRCTPVDSDKDAADFMIERLKRRDMVKKAMFNKTLAKRI